MYIVLLILGNHCHFARSVIFIPVLVFSRRFSRGLRHWGPAVQRRIETAEKAKNET